MRQIMIVGYLSAYGAFYGAIVGGVASAIVGVFYAGFGFCVAIPFGIMGGLIVGFGAGFACGLVTLPFDASRHAITPRYRVAMAITGIVLTPILVILIAQIYVPMYMIFPQVGIFISPAEAVLALLGALLAIPVSQRLIMDYSKLISETHAPSV